MSYCLDLRDNIFKGINSFLLNLMLFFKRGHAAPFLSPAAAEKFLNKKQTKVCKLTNVCFANIRSYIANFLTFVFLKFLKAAFKECLRILKKDNIIFKLLNVRCVEQQSCSAPLFRNISLDAGFKGSRPET